MKMYVGTYSDEAIISVIRKSEPRYNEFMMFTEDMTGDEIKSKIIDAGLISWALTHFFADNTGQAYRQAKSMGLKNFSEVSDKLYEL